LAATVLAAAAPITPASADPGDTLRGGCGFDTEQSQILTNGQNQGVIYVAALSEEASGLPSTATVACWIDVNGVEQPGTRLTTTATGVVLNSAQISFSSVEGDLINECQQVTFADGSTWTAPDGNVGVDCPAVTVGGPPIIDELIDLVEFLLETARTLADSVTKSFIDPIVCPNFQTVGNFVGGGVLGVVRIHPDGDIYVANVTGTGYTREYNCPPY